MMDVVMTTAILAVLTAAQQSPVDRFGAFLRSASDRSVVYRASYGGSSAKIKLSYQQPNLQYMEIESAEEKGRFFQAAGRVLYVNDRDRLYYEYKGFPSLVGPPPESDLGSIFYPGALLSWAREDGLKGMKATGTEVVGGETFDLLRLEVQAQTGMTVYALRVASSGEPKRIQMLGQGAPPVVFDIEGFGWPLKDMRAWSYLPPSGYMVGNAPKLHKPFQAGNRVEWGKWVDGGGRALNMDRLNSTGVAVVFTSGDGTPDGVIAQDLGALKASLAKLKVNMVEVHLEAKTAPKRDWPVTLDKAGTITRQFDPPYTPYIFFVRKDRYVVGAWAGYAKDQKARMIKTAIDLYSPKEEE